MAKIVIIDDSEDWLRFAEQVFERAGHTVITVDTAFGATNLIERHKPDLVLVDVKMPGLSGDNLVRVLKSRVNDVTSVAPTVLLLSGVPEDELRRTAFEVGADGHIQKAQDIDQMLARVEETLNIAS